MAPDLDQFCSNVQEALKLALKFTASAFESRVPEYPGPIFGADSAFLNGLNEKITSYMEKMEAVRLKDGLKTAMEYSSDCNGYF